jgi:hypothetical protein
MAHPQWIPAGGGDGVGLIPKERILYESFGFIPYNRIGHLKQMFQYQFFLSNS